DYGTNTWSARLLVARAASRALLMNRNPKGSPCDGLSVASVAIFGTYGAGDDVAPPSTDTDSRSNPRGTASCASAGGWVAHQILGRRQVLVPRDRADLPLAEFAQRRRLQPLRVVVCVVDRQYV